MVIDERVGAAELDRLAETLVPPCHLGEFVLEGLVARTATALVFIARTGGPTSSELILKVTGRVYAPIAARELHLLNACSAANLRGVVRPLVADLVWIEQPEATFECVAAIQLPALSGGDLVQWIGARATRTGALGPGPALAVGAIVGQTLRDMLRLPRPIVHGDVKPQNVLLPQPDAPLAELTLVDLDASEQLEVGPDDLALAHPDVARCLATDVNGFGELLFMLATAREPPAEGRPDPHTGNGVFDAFVANCITAEPGTPGYASLADAGLWRDFDRAQAVERDRNAPRALSEALLSRPVLALAGVLLLGLLVLAVASRLTLSV